MWIRREQCFAAVAAPLGSGSSLRFARNDDRCGYSSRLRIAWLSMSIRVTATTMMIAMVDTVR